MMNLVFCVTSIIMKLVLFQLYNFLAVLNMNKHGELGHYRPGLSRQHQGDSGTDPASLQEIS